MIGLGFGDAVSIAAGMARDVDHCLSSFGFNPSSRQMKLRSAQRS
jgi:hypothetical protein